MPQTEVSDAPASTETPYTLRYLDSFAGSIEAVPEGQDGDSDWIRVQLEAGVLNSFTLTGAGLDDGALVIRMPSGVWLRYADSHSTGPETLLFRAVESGDFYIEVYDANGGTGGYTLSWDMPPAGVEAEDLPQDSSTPAQVSADNVWYDGYLGAGDPGDWIAFQPVAGAIYRLQYDLGADSYDFSLDAVLEDLEVTIVDARGALVSTGEPVIGSWPWSFDFGAATEETLYIHATRATEGDTGPYQVRLEQVGSVALASTAEMVDYLTLGYWQDFYQALNDEFGAGHPIPTAPPAFRAPGGVVEVNLDALSAEQKALVWMALEAWSDASGVSFVAGNSPRTLVETYYGDITFVTRTEGYFEGVGRATDADFSTVNAQVQIFSDRFVNGPTPTAGDWSALLGLIGEALGLGHMSAQAADPIFIADTPQQTLMATQSQSENMFSVASDAPAVTLMPLDLAAIQSLYGAAPAGDPSLGDTVWGIGTTLGDYGSALFEAFLRGSGDPVAYTIRDGGGADVLNLSGTTAAARIDLSQGGVSDLGGLTGNLVIAPGSLIEAVRAGDGDDRVSGNAVANDLSGGGGNDHLLGLAGADVLRGDAGDDTLEGGDGADTLVGGDGNDSIIGGDSAADLRDVVYAGEGDDLILGGHGNDELNAGSGIDTVGGGFGADTIYGFDGDDVLTGEAWSDLIYGGAGNDFINGGFGYDRVNGGAGADRFYHLGVADHGSDWVQDYTAADGDVLLFGGGAATAADFVVHFAETANAGQAGVAEAFVAYVPTGQVFWSLIDGGGQAELNLMAGGQVFDLLA